MSVDHVTRDAGDLHAYRTEIPNLVFAKLAAGEITADDFVLYCILKKTAGERGASTKATKTLAKEAKITVTAVVAGKRRLINAGLIDVEAVERTASGMNLGGRPQHVVTMTDVWPENMAMFAPATRVGSQAEQVLYTAQQVPYLEQASSAGGTKEENIPPLAKARDGERPPRSKATAPHADLVVALLDELGEDNLNFARHVRDAKALAAAGQTPDDVRRIVRWLLRTKGEFFATEPLTMTTVRKYVALAPKSDAANLDDRSPETPSGRRRRGPTVLSGVYR